MKLERILDAGVSLLPAGLQPLARRIDVAFLRFAMVGAIGFIVDLILLMLLVKFSGWSAVRLSLGASDIVLTTTMQARFVSFPIAVASTWALNRNWTFGGSERRNMLAELASYVAVQGAGGAANVGAYLLLLGAIPALQPWPVIPLAMGSAVGLCLTFAGSKYWAFRGRK
jgi:putative flippase GtrA